MAEPDRIPLWCEDGAKGGVRDDLHAATVKLIPKPAYAVLAAAAKGETPWPVYLHGPPGSGKTMAALYMLKRSYGVFVSADHWAWSRYHESSRYQARLERMRQVVGTTSGALYYPLVVVDEIGLRDTATDWQLGAFLSLLNARKGLPLIVTGNISPAEVVKRYDGRIADRLCTAGTVVNLAGTSQRDWRPAQPKK